MLPMNSYKYKGEILFSLPSLFQGRFKKARMEMEPEERRA